MRLPDKRGIARLAGIALACAVLVPIAGTIPSHAQTWPARPIRLVVPFAAGGSTDVVARLVAAGMSGPLGQQVVVENKAGAGGSAGSADVARSAPDGYSVLVATVSTHAINPALYEKLPFDVIDDFTPVTHLVDIPNVLLISTQVPARTIAELKAYAAAHPGQLNYASPGVGSVGHLQSHWFATLAGIPMTHVPYRGAGPAMQDLMSGQVQLMIDNVPTALEQIRAGKVNALLVTSARRIPQLPDTLSSTDAGLPQFIGYSWLALLAPKATPDAAVQALYAAAKTTLADPQVRQRLEALSATIAGEGPRETAAFLRAERDKWAPVVKETGVRLE
ncbi:tripartite tricarboxylate transporter substrate binding protein [Roseiarcaceae bacterium H3SJ34-1]|uniref:Bug family tripartite tricarboxylate transporter substrate binding protein n=1 Tax=Terripilifer ovatus TaxID=3032367 RepID=UPI003AB95831|nr:tripartite tricarboxylate transporter substrate binding protein [Roseiarcaceae bacterium H3SJ34-1]